MPYFLETKTRPIRSHLTPAMTVYVKYGPDADWELESHSSWDDFGIGTQITTSENHGHDWRKKTKGTSDIGGPFDSRRQYVKTSGALNTVMTEFPGPLDWTYKAYFTPIPEIDYDMPFPEYLDSSDEDLAGFGTTAIARCSPTNQVANASTAVGELIKDGIPDLPLIGTFRKRAKVFWKLGNEFLNTAFGWLPLVNDVQKLANGVLRLDELLIQFERDSGRNVRRSWKFPVEHEVETAIVEKNALPGSYHFGIPDNSGNPDLPLGKQFIVSERTIIRKFEGCFTYYLPDDYDSRKAIARRTGNAAQILGGTLDPETLWNLAPWSWAVDWFSNAGDVAHNVSMFARNGLVLRYGYITEHTVHKRTHYHRGQTGFPSFSDDDVSSISFVSETKRRLPAGPYGFAISWDGLSTFQLSVLSALGITRR